jgi:hypothetical protein
MKMLIGAARIATRLQVANSSGRASDLRLVARGLEESVEVVGPAAEEAEERIDE